MITIGPGNAFWSAFGHTALAINDRVYGFGYFSFEDEGLLQAFINNQMYYDIGISDFSDELAMAEWQNRTFTVQNLDFSAEQVQQIEDYLEWHSLPENQSYRYDYFINNCATKIRDIVDNAWEGRLKAEYSKLTQDSYFTQTFPAKNQALMNFGIVLGYGWPAYENRTAWELMAFPVFFQEKLTAMSSDLVTSTTTVFQSDYKNSIYSWMNSHWFLWCYVVVLFLSLSFKKSRKLGSGFIYASQVILGALILYFWFFSGYDITKWNFNVLLFSPLTLLLLFSNQFKWLLMASYLGWVVVAIMLQAWYFFPIALLHLYGLKQMPKVSN
ncbi:MAG: DUF4105 domain-containing protein [Xanthomonadales bacterium]|nr:DUF4105 domain-containing protein [Xanthomonadales bacterium]